MKKTMRAVQLYAEWDPRPDFKLGRKDIKDVQTYLGSKVWRNSKVKVTEKEVPRIKSDEVLIEVKACGICGSDVHMAQYDKEGYTLYPGLTGFPCTLGHEYGGVVVKAGKKAIDKSTNEHFKVGTPVTAEEMMWCGECNPCADGYPNHCERLDETGFNVDGAMAQYIAMKARYCHNLEPLKQRYKGLDLFLAGSLVEPTCVAYNAVIERGGGVQPGENAVIFGGGPIGLAATAVLKKAGGRVFVSEPSEKRRVLAKKLGADYVLNPFEENVPERILELTNGLGAKLYLEATGLPVRIFPDIEEIIWDGKQINSTVAIVARADVKIPINAEVYQVRRAQIVGSQGHSGHGTFEKVISAMASGMDMTPMVTKKISLDDVVENLKLLQTDKDNCKITITNFE